MMTIEELTACYRGRTAGYGAELAAIQRRIYRVGTLRLLLFAGAVACAIALRHEGWAVILLAVAACMVPFLVLMRVHDRLFRARDFMQKMVEINEDELAALDYRTDCFEAGEAWRDPSHAYSYDLDVFGEHSLFQYVNRTSTYFGERTLATWLTRPLTRPEDITSRQRAVRELTPKLDYRQRFRATGLTGGGRMGDGEKLLQWAASQSRFRHSRLLKALCVVFPALNALMFVLGAADVLAWQWLGGSFVTSLIVSIGLQKRITLFQTSYDDKLSILGSYIRQMQLMEDLRPECEALRVCCGRLSDGNEPASAAIRQLSRQMNALNQRNNMLAYMVLNGFLFWEVRQVMSIERWKERHAASLPVWLDAIGEMDALCSLATFAYNHPDYAYPVPVDKPFTLCAERMGHPLIHRDRCVRNDIHMTKRPYFIIVTGANMAGKSTYLRTVGVNYLLACTGAPVCAVRMEFYPARLVTSLRTTDSLNDNESYFFAELKRLKDIIDRLNRGEELFVILDEILKGTNSVDKQKGSLSLVKQLLQLGANGIIATHDLQLGSLAGRYPDHIANYRFEATIAGDELTFSYRMQEGVARNMNACFLMKKMGIFVED